MEPPTTPELMIDDHSDEVAATLAVAQQFVEAFSARDWDTLASTLNYPHVRLADGGFTTFETRDQFIQRNIDNNHRLDAQGFDHSVLRRSDPIQAGPDKVHLAIINDRCRADGEMYLAFNTLWIVTLQDDHWGVKFRSSYLINNPSAATPAPRPRCAPATAPLDRPHRHFTDEHRPVELLVFRMSPDDVDEFLRVDHEIWTLGEAASLDGSDIPFLAKEVWLNDARPGEVTIVFVWPDQATWSAVADEELQQQLTDAFDARFDRPYELAREIHEEQDYGLHRWSRFERGR